ncbi:MAG: hypothetical protein FWE53_00115 [Firmicutes bacterium]|nr:hypothetical protein [Bacillota bacterium]
MVTFNEKAVLPKKLMSMVKAGMAEGVPVEFLRPEGKTKEKTQRGYFYVTKENAEVVHIGEPGSMPPSKRGEALCQGEWFVQACLYWSNEIESYVYTENGEMVGLPNFIYLGKEIPHGPTSYALLLPSEIKNEKLLSTLFDARLALEEKTHTNNTKAIGTTEAIKNRYEKRRKELESKLNCLPQEKVNAIGEANNKRDAEEKRYNTLVGSLTTAKEAAIANADTGMKKG